MKKTVTAFIGAAVLLLACAGLAQVKSVNEAVDEFLKDLPPEDAWSTWLVETGPIYGNYCGAGHGDVTYEAPCLSRLDCICKAHEFGHSLKHYLNADHAFIDETLGEPITFHDQEPNYETFLQIMTATLFAAKLKGLDIEAKARQAHDLYRQDPEKALRMVENILDENGTFLKKIDEINAERIKFEEQSLDMRQNREPKMKNMALSTQPLNIIAGVFSVHYEYRISGIASARAGLSFLGAGFITDTYLGFGNNKDFSGFLSVGLKNFVSGEPLKSGVYIEGLLDAGYEHVINLRAGQQPYVRDLAFVPAVIFGVEKVFPVGLQLDVGLGVGMHLGVPITDIPEGYNTHFVVPKFRASVGYAW